MGQGYLRNAAECSGTHLDSPAMTAVALDDLDRETV
jgi:hypothetical protein